MSFLKKWKGTALGVVAAPFTGGLSLAGGYLYDVNKQQNEANKKAIDRANAYDMYTWDLANQYNDPKAQMQRLAAAGLNPNLVYGSGNVAGNTSGVAGSNGVASQTAFNAIEKGLPLAQGLANLRNTNSQNQLLQYQMGQTEAQTAEIQAQTSMMPYRQAYTEAQTEVMKWNLQYAKDHGLPVGSMPGFESTFASWLNRGSEYLKKNGSPTHPSSFNPYRDGNVYGLF